MSDEGKLDYKVPGAKVAKLALFWSSDFFGVHDQDVIATARKMLTQHGLNLECWPANQLRTPDRTFDFGKSPIEPAQYVAIYSQLADICAAAGKTSHLMTVFCQFKYPANGLTITDAPTKCFVRPMVFISPTVNADFATLIHEMGHASGLDHDHTSNKPTERNFMNETESRATMMKWQLEKMSKAFF